MRLPYAAGPDEGDVAVRVEVGQRRELAQRGRVPALDPGSWILDPGEAETLEGLGLAPGQPAQPQQRLDGGELLASIYFSPVSLSRRAVRAKAVSPVALTYFHRFRSRLDGAVPRQVLQPVGPAGYLDQVAVVAHPVRDRARRHVVPEHPAPAADPHVGGDDRRALLVARRYQLEQQVRARAA